MSRQLSFSPLLMILSRERKLISPIFCFPRRQTQLHVEHAFTGPRLRNSPADLRRLQEHGQISTFVPDVFRESFSDVRGTYAVLGRIEVLVADGLHDGFMLLLRIGLFGLSRGSQQTAIRNSKTRVRAYSSHLHLEDHMRRKKCNIPVRGPFGFGRRASGRTDHGHSMSRYRLSCAPSNQHVDVIDALLMEVSVSWILYAMMSSAIVTANLPRLVPPNFCTIHFGAGTSCSPLMLAGAITAVVDDNDDVRRGRLGLDPLPPPKTLELQVFILWGGLFYWIFERFTAPMGSTGLYDAEA